MKKNIITYFFLCIAFYGNFIVCNDVDRVDDKVVDFVFDQLLYPSSSLQTIRSDVMQLWGLLHAASLSSQFQLQLHQELDDFVQKILDVYANVYLVNKEFKKNKDLYDKQEIESLGAIIFSIKTLFESMMQGNQSVEIDCFKTVIKNIQKKIEQMLVL